MTTTHADERTDLDVDLTQDVTCAVDNCSTSASWLGVVRHIDGDNACRSAPYCTPHRIEVEEFCGATWRAGRRVICQAHRWHSLVTWRSL